MASAPEDTGEDLLPSANPQAKTRVRRRARKRDGPPQLQFLTATNPSQFKAENVKRSVRSQAMMQYRYKADQQKREGKGTSEAKAHHAEGPPPLAERILPVRTDATSHQARENPLMSQILDEQQEQQYLYPSTSAAWWGTNPNESFGETSWLPATAALMPTQPSRYQRALAILPPNSATQKVVDYEESDAREELKSRLLAAKLSIPPPLGNSVDPFNALPQFSNPEINSLYLFRKCNRAFFSPSGLVKWLPACLSHRHLLLSATILASTWLDMHAGCSGDSKRTVIVKGEAIRWIEERLRDPVAQLEDSTLIVILHLLTGEMWSCNERTLRIHEAGIAKLVALRGGMDGLGGNGATKQVAAGCCYNSDIICEATPLPLFHAWDPLENAPIEEWEAIPESPLFCPRGDFFTILRDPKCSEITYELLCDMRDLTDLFIAHNAGLGNVLDPETQEDAARLAPSLLNYDIKVAGIRARLASLPSAYTLGLPTTNDWVYESCRIASIIYASAIIMRVPFSIAAEIGRNPILEDTVSMPNSLAGGCLVSTRLTDALYEALEKSSTANIWGDMSGTLYWVTSVGAAAARTPVSINVSRTPKSRSEAYAIWVRRCMIMFATRTLVLLVFQHPIPVILAQKKLLKVQELIGSGSSK